MKKKLATIIIVLGLFSTKDIQAQSYYTRGNLETNLGSFSTINGQWIAISPSNNTLGTNYYQGLNFGFDANNYVSLVNGVGTNDLYFGRWEYAWKDWNKIWHSGNLNNSSIDFTAKTLNTTKINLSVPGSNDQIDAFTIDVSSFGTAENANRSSFFRVRDIGGGNWIPFIIKGNGNVGIGTANPSSLLTVAGNIASREVKVTVDAGADFVFEKGYDLPSLTSLDSYIKENKHLPEIASAKEMQANGINLSEMNIKLLQKIEELTLYTIEQNKKLKEQNDRIEQQNSKIEEQNLEFRLLKEKVKKIELSSK